MKHVKIINVSTTKLVLMVTADSLLKNKDIVVTTERSIADQATQTAILQRVILIAAMYGQAVKQPAAYLHF